MDKYKINADKFKNECDLNIFDFETTEDVDNWEGIIGQKRAMESPEFGPSIETVEEGIEILTGIKGGSPNNQLLYI
ncbi:MAG: hypothetical protein ACTHVE_00220 [Senegalia sp. (in: firmicutes)]|uniref:hypothetical protein n=1 Tax=Senegalia sp. (in: firmicutes) TaxID=1924098 RepID=UPI003F9D2C19